MNLFDPTKPSVAVREAHLKTGFADYLLFVDGQALGVVEAKKVGVPLSGVEAQSARYAVGLRPPMRAWRPEIPLPFRYESTGVEMFFTNRLAPTRAPGRCSLSPAGDTTGVGAAARHAARPFTHHAATYHRQTVGPQVKAITNLEQSLAQDKPRALVQMAMGSGKTFTAVNFIYRLISQAGAKRVLFLVDRNNLGKQDNKEFVQFETPDDGRKFFDNQCAYSRGKGTRLATFQFHSIFHSVHPIIDSLRI